MIEAQRGRIINIASIAGKVGEPTASAYSAAKFGVIGFTRSLALEVAQYDILVNAICPGPIPTALGQQGWRDGADVQGVELDARHGARQFALAAAAAWARPNRSRGWRCSSHPTIATSPPARRSTSTAAS